jgi:adenylate cyclase
MNPLRLAFRAWIFAAALVVAFCASKASAEPPVFEVPVDRGPVELAGEWEFVPGAFVERVDHGLPSVRTRVPASWDDLVLPDGRRGLDVRAGTYLARLRTGAVAAASQTPIALAFPYQIHAARLVVRSGSGRWEALSGTPALRAEDEAPLHRPVRLDFAAQGDGTVDVFVHVSSHVERRRGGLRRALTFGPQSALEYARRMLEWREIFLVGTLGLAALYHAALALLRPRERAPLWFALLAAVMALRTLVFTNFLELTNPPSIGWLLSQQIVYATIALPVFFTLRYLDALFPTVLPSRVLRTSDFLGLALTLVPCLGVTSLFTFASNASQLYALVAIVVGIGSLVRHAFRTRDALAMGALFGFGTLALSAVRDIVAVRIGHTSVYYAPYGLLGFMVIQALVVAGQNERARRHTEDLLRSISNFVPKGFLELLGRRDLSEVNLGDAVERDLTVLFADVRGFTSISERLGPNEIFGLLNEWFGRIGPHVPANGGFIDKYIGDAIMALFPRSPSDAVRAAIAMQQEASEVLVAPTQSRLRSASSSTVEALTVRPLAIGIGVHRGSTMLGTIGERERFEATVISDAVNLAARLEQATVTLGVRVLVSGEVVADLEADLRGNLRALGSFQVVGRRRPIELFEVVEADPEPLRSQKLAARDRFEAARSALLAGRAYEAKAAFDALAAETPKDGAVAFFQRALMGDGATVTGGVIVLHEKSAASSKARGTA